MNGVREVLVARVLGLFEIPVDELLLIELFLNCATCRFVCGRRRGGGRGGGRGGCRRGGSDFFGGRGVHDELFLEILARQRQGGARLSQLTALFGCRSGSGRVG